MKQLIIRPKSRITVHGVLREGQSLEEFLRKAQAGNEPIQATAKMTYNDRKDGVLPQHDIRTDRWDLAMMETDRLHMTRAAQQKSVDFPEPKKDVQQKGEGSTVTGEA